MSSFEKIIKDYIEGVCKTDEVLAKKYADSAQDIAGCCEYIKSQAKKKAQNGCAVIEVAQVFGWAIHYFDEGLKAPEKAPEAQVKVSSNPIAKEPAKPQIKPVLKPKKAADEGMMSLFNFDEEDE